MNEDRLFKFLTALCIALAIVVAFEGGMWWYKKNISEEKSIQTQAELEAQLQLQIAKLNQQIDSKEAELAQLQKKHEDSNEKQTELLKQINQLRTQVAGLTTQTEPAEVKKYPFAVPSNGVLGSIHGSFGGDMYTMKHLGVDIWTTKANNGALPTHKGNEVFSACDGKVVTIYEPNASITIQCDPIKGDYNVPAKSVFTHYAHMGNVDTKEMYFLVKKYQRVARGEKIGYQGDVSSYFPEMRNVHLHFSVFTGKSETDPKGGAINPCLYIGGNCQKEGEIFATGKN